MIAWMERYQNKNFKLLTLVAVLVTAVLFPYGWLANRWQLFDGVVNWLFATEAMHIVGHLGLYGGLGTAVLIIFPQLCQRPYHYLLLIFSVGLTQEILQLLTFKGRFFTTNELFDLSVDLLAAGIVFAVGKIITQQ
jgi:hypothetical protein